jgi:hypothetical protein
MEALADEWESDADAHDGVAGRGALVKAYRVAAAELRAALAAAPAEQPEGEETR